MKRQSGDQRGDHIPSDFGRPETRLVFRSTTWIAAPLAGGGAVPKASDAPSGDQEGFPVTRLPALSIGHLLEGTAIEGHHVDPGRVSLAHSGKCNLLPIRRPVRMRGPSGRCSKSEALATINRAAPERSIRHRNVGNPFPIFGELELSPRYPTEFGNELAGFQVITEKFAAGLGQVTIDKQALAVGAGNRPTRRQRAVGQLERSTPRPLEQSHFLAEGPDVDVFLPARLENEVLAIWCPITAAHIRFWIPAGKQRIRAVSINPCFPKGVGDADAGINSEAHPAPVGRPAHKIRLTSNRCQLADFRPVATCDMQFLVPRVDQLLTIRGPGAPTVLSYKVAQPPRGPTEQWSYPELTTCHGNYTPA